MAKDTQPKTKEAGAEGFALLTGGWEHGQVSQKRIFELALKNK